MMSKFLLPECVAREDGVSAEIALEAACGKILPLTLGVTRAVEHACIEISIFGSQDRKRWSLLHSFPRKFYCGAYLMVLDLTLHPRIRYLRAEWKMDRLGKPGPAPTFDFYISIDDPQIQTVGVA